MAMIPPGQAVAEKEHCKQRDHYLEYTGVYKLIDRFVNELLGCGYLPLNPFPLFAQQALIAETQMAMQQRSFAEFLRIAEKYPPPEPRRFELEHPSPDSPLSTIFVTAKGNDHNRFEVACGWSAMVDSINCMGVLTLRNALNKCKNSLLLAGLNKVTQLGSCPTDVYTSMFGSVVHAAAAPYGFERLRLNHIFSVEAEDFSQALTEFAKRVLQDVLAAVEPSATGDFLFQEFLVHSKFTDTPTSWTVESFDVQAKFDRLQGEIKSATVEKQRLLLCGYFLLETVPGLNKFVFVQKQYSLFFKHIDPAEREAFVPMPLESIDAGLFLRAAHAEGYLAMFKETDIEDFRARLRVEIAQDALRAWQTGSACDSAESIAQIEMLEVVAREHIGVTPKFIAYAKDEAKNKRPFNYHRGWPPLQGDGSVQGDVAASSPRRLQLIRSAFRSLPWQVRCFGLAVTTLGSCLSILEKMLDAGVLQPEQRGLLVENLTKHAAFIFEQVSLIVSKRVLSETHNLKAKVEQWLGHLYDPSVQQLTLTDESIDSLARLSHALATAADSYLDCYLRQIPACESDLAIVARLRALQLEVEESFLDEKEVRRLAKQREKKLRDEVKHRNKMSPEEVAARVRVRAWGASTRVIDLERSQLNAAKRKSFPDGMVMEATTQQYFVSTRFDYFLKCLLDEFFCKPVWANPYPVVIFQAKRFALSAQLTKAVRRRDSGFAKQDIVPIGRNKERPVLWVKKAHTVDRGISKAYGHVCALEYCNPQVLEDVFGEYMRTTVGKVFPSAGHGNVECGVHVGVRENALWYGSLADAAMVVEASFVKIYVISGRYMRIAHEIFIHQIYDFCVWLGSRPGNLVTHIEAMSWGDTTGPVRERDPHTIVIPAAALDDQESAIYTLRDCVRRGLYFTVYGILCIKGAHNVKADVQFFLRHEDDDEEEDELFDDDGGSDGNSHVLAGGAVPTAQDSKLALKNLPRLLTAVGTIFLSLKAAKAAFGSLKPDDMARLLDATIDTMKDEGKSCYEQQDYFRTMRNFLATDAYIQHRHQQRDTELARNVALQFCC
eukprot:INCI6244.10.p1 GENE.INCI6244.10~~INCI6244.10.p1  ORF type:complete len:1059 (-),score=175.17 INCI6244.10:81-3257(-)